MECRSFQKADRAEANKHIKEWCWSIELDLLITKKFCWPQLMLLLLLLICLCYLVHRRINRRVKVFESCWQLRHINNHLRTAAGKTDQFRSLRVRFRLLLLLLSSVISQLAKYAKLPSTNTHTYEICLLWFIATTTSTSKFTLWSNLNRKRVSERVIQ